jgi:hypothetical protein
MNIVKTRIETDKGLRDGYIILSKVVAFREHMYDVNRTIVFANNKMFEVYMSFRNFEKAMLEYYEQD